MYRSIPAVSQWCSKRTKPCLDDVSATTVQGMRVNVDWLKAKTILHLNIRVQSTDSNNPDHNLEVHQSKLALRIMGKYSSEGAAREWSTVVDISMTPPSFKLVPLSLPRSPLSKTPKQVFF